MNAPTTPKTRPILFSAPMARAILEGRKFQTRRIVKPQDSIEFDPNVQSSPIYRHSAKCPGYCDYGCEVLPCPYGVPGDRLWVRETWQAWNRTNVEYDEWEAITPERRAGIDWAEWVATNGKPDSVEYRATSESAGPWTPSIHMPRWASRITLEVTGVRVERLNDITEGDAVAEGISVRNQHHWGRAETGIDHNAPTHAFRMLWESINGADSWATNPWVWVVEFRRVTP